MLVKELIEKLQKFDPELEVSILNRDTDWYTTLGYTDVDTIELIDNSVVINN